MSSNEIRRRRLNRLREELADESVPLPISNGGVGDLVVEEILYARYPPSHEGKVPCYGSLVFEDGRKWFDKLDQKNVLLDRFDADYLRLFADGRSAFLVRDLEDVRGIVCFDRTMEYEANLVNLQQSTGATVVQRTDYDVVRIYTSNAVTMWNGIEWKSKLHAPRLHDPILRLVPQADPEILEGLLDFCVHWLSPSRQGATLVWYLVDDLERPLPHISFDEARESPKIRLATRNHFGALLNAIAQMDGATVVDHEGVVTHFRTFLLPSDRADELLAPTGGTRHTSARRFSFDEPRALVFVVAKEGSVSVFSDGSRIVLVRPEPQSSLAEDLDPNGREYRADRQLDCPTCHKKVLVRAVSFKDRKSEVQKLTCPVCRRRALRVDAYQVEVLGVRKELDDREPHETISSAAPTSGGQSETSNGRSESPAGQIESSNGHSESPAGQIESSDGQSDSDGGGRGMAVEATTAIDATA